jgi:hypothetical protein
MQKFDHKFGFEPFFAQKLSKVAENCDQNIGPRYCILCEDKQLQISEALVWAKMVSHARSFVLFVSILIVCLFARPGCSGEFSCFSQFSSSLSY